MRIISFINQKGGVGKTTSCSNIGVGLAVAGRRVLLIDLDPQFNLTSGLGMRLDDEDLGIYDVLRGDATIEEATRSRRVELEDVDAEIHIVGSSLALAGADIQLAHVTSRELLLKRALSKLDPDRYDYVLVDCPPHLGYLADNALYATRNVLIPALAESTSKRALELLFDHVESLEKDYEIDIVERGVVANRVEETNEAKEMMEWFRQAFPDVPVWEVRKRVALQRAFTDGHSLAEYRPDLDMADVFEAVAADLDEQFGFQEVRA